MNMFARKNSFYTIPLCKIRMGKQQLAEDENFGLVSTLAVIEFLSRL